MTRFFDLSLFLLLIPYGFRVNNYAIQYGNILRFIFMCKVFPLVVDYNPRLSNVSKSIKKDVNLLYSSPVLERVFPLKSIISAFRRCKNLKEIIALSNLKTQTVLPRSSLQGSVKCRKKCDLCQHFFLESNVLEALLQVNVIKESKLLVVPTMSFMQYRVRDVSYSIWALPPRN